MGGEMPMDPFSLNNQRYTIGDLASCGNDFWIPVVQGALKSVDNYQWLDDKPTSNSSVVGKPKWATTEPNGGYLEHCVAF